MRDAGASIDPPTDPSAKVSPDDPSTAPSSGTPPRKHPVRTGVASLPRGVSADIFAAPVPPLTAVPPAAAGTGRTGMPPPPAAGVEPWPVRDKTARAEPPPPPPPVDDDSSHGSVLRYGLIGLFALLLLAYAVPAVLMAGRILPGTTVLGVDIGGQSLQEAAATLRDGLYARTRAPIIVQQDTRRLAVYPEKAGLRLDVEATLAQIPTGIPGPLEVWEALTSGREVKPVVAVDRAKLAAAVAQDVAAALESPGQEGGVVFHGLTPVAVWPRTGRTIDEAAVADQIAKAYLTTESPVPVTVRVDRPRVGAAEVRRAVEWARRAVATPLTLTDGHVSARLPPAAIAAGLTFVPDDGTLRPKFAADRAIAGIERRFVDPDEAARDATFAIVDGRPRLVPGRPGKRIDTERLAADVVAALDRGSRTVRVSVTSGPPRLSDMDALKLGIKEELARFTVRYACCPRAEDAAGNADAAARLLNGRLIGPGETFSLNEVVGRRDAAEGFAGDAAPTVIRGETGSDVPGMSAVATAMLNAALRAGLEVVEFTPPEVHEPSSPIGLTAAVSYPRPDLRWRNDSPYGVLVQADAGTTGIRIALWSTKRFDVEIQGPVVRDVTRVSDVRGSGAGCVPVPGREGFTAEVTRVLRRGGEVVRRQTFRTEYRPRAGVVCAD